MNFSNREYNTWGTSFRHEYGLINVHGMSFFEGSRSSQIDIVKVHWNIVTFNFELLAAGRSPNFCVQ